MCTAATYKTKDFYFGRTLDYEFSYGDEVVITPRNYPFHFRHIDAIESHYAMIGMAHVVDNDPLYYDAFNECGLAMAGLNFVGNAAYYDIEEGKDNIAQFEFIPWILGTCANLEEAKTTLIHMNLTNTPYSEQFPLAQLHWIIADQSGAITVEAMEDGMHIYENNVGVLTNNPPFNIQMFLLNQYMNLSSSSRFAKVAFTKLHSVSGDSENESVNQFFHILGSVDQQRGCCDVNGKYEITLYTSCCNTQKGIYYYTTYDNHQISAVDMTKEDLNTKNLICYEVITGEHIQMQN